MKTDILRQNIPIGWEEKSLGNFLSILKGKLPKKTYEIADSESVPYLSIKYLDGAEFKYAHKNDGLIADKNDLLVVADGSGSGRMYRGYYGLVSSTFLKISSQSPNIISNDYLEVIFSHLDFTKPRFRKGGAIPHFDFKQLKDVKILLPPLKEQQKIAEILGAVDEDIAKTQELIDTTEKLKRGLMQELFTPKNSWLNRNLSEVANIIMGQSPSSKNYNEIDNGLPLIQGNADIKDRKSIKRFSTSEITREVKKGDIIMGVRAPVGCIATASFDSCIGRGVCGIQPQKIDKNYLYYYLVSKETEFEKKAQGSTFTAINSSEVRKINIVFPNNKEEQKEIADILSSIDKKISFNKKLKEKLITLKKGLMQDLLSGRVRVNIN